MEYLRPQSFFRENQRQVTYLCVGEEKISFSNFNTYISVQNNSSALLFFFNPYYSFCIQTHQYTGNPFL